MESMPKQEVMKRNNQKTRKVLEDKNDDHYI